MSTPDRNQPAASMADAMAELMDSVNTARETVDGYRATLLASSYSPTAAEAMAMDLHHHILEVIFAGVKNGMQS